MTNFVVKTAPPQIPRHARQGACSFGSDSVGQLGLSSTQSFSDASEFRAFVDSGWPVLFGFDGWEVLHLQQHFETGDEVLCARLALDVETKEDARDSTVFNLMFEVGEQQESPPEFAKQ